ncbi:hypothetical protein NUW54_g11665 [Trametes sanguinea]|uniref:Uncharacterized protein n=1 Tax=Trametes sanguinea TaxID=158606 RepID=A0ACC1NA96_9APHY|nr:hypothetical protein NUW54_g11665 [Trametes sanguinea]
MPPADVEDIWSDSDDELEADVETSVDLGVPDGPVDDPAVLLDPTVSRIGGHPVRCPFASSCSFRILIFEFHRVFSHRSPPRAVLPRYAPSAHLACDMPQLLTAHGAARPNLVPTERKPQRPRPSSSGAAQTDPVSARKEGRLASRISSGPSVAAVSHSNTYCLLRAIGLPPRAARVVIATHTTQRSDSREQNDVQHLLVAGGRVASSCAGGFIGGRTHARTHAVLVPRGRPSQRGANEAPPPPQRPAFSSPASPALPACAR